eukprot:TRINITY_DN7558_c0_g1_i2.p1 TRINITY_DN7558_c0_g1~~TRINITY_DN7558_c0_g1_i2.p1  ORF type:complete len:155 (+),score=16.92 TRINITY_DN7558_c0_g1_i2:857-1321(+)
MLSKCSLCICFSHSPNSCPKKRKPHKVWKPLPSNSITSLSGSHVSETIGTKAGSPSLEAYATGSVEEPPKVQSSEALPTRALFSPLVISHPSLTLVSSFRIMQTDHSSSSNPRIFHWGQSPSVADPLPFHPSVLFTDSLAGSCSDLQGGSPQPP